MNRVDGEARLTFDDVLLLPARSAVLPSEVSLKGAFCKGVALNLPVASAAMDTVTESDMAISMALQGGIGVIHKNLSAEQQAAEVRRVKRKINFIVENPATVTPATTLAELKAVGDGDASSFPVLEGGKLVGIVTSRDVRFEKNPAARVADLMTRDVVFETVASLKEFSPGKAVELLHKHRIERLPLVDAQGKLLGLVTYRDLTVSSKYPQASRDAGGRLVVAAAVSPSDGVRAAALVEAGVDVLVLDTAHGNSQGVIDAASRFAGEFSVPIVAGNVCTADGAKNLIDAGVAGVKGGVGAGSICTTRIISGCGAPQLSAILECAEACREAGVPLIADGGIRYSGDAAKALAAGASCVMLGNMLAGTDESPGRVVMMAGRKYKTYRGMGSLGAMALGGRERYFQGGVPSSKLVPEGIEGVVPFKGSVEEVLYQIAGGVKSGMGYCGCGTLEEFWKAKFIRISPAGHAESHPHDVVVTQEAPNYRAPQ
ncbi:MAG: IMP dehydrogenase [Candidatus Micrarchaeota archaeon]